MKEAIIIENLKKKFIINTEKASYIKHSIIDLFKKKRGKKEEFWALNGINCNIYRGETFGIVGRNGSGKSTLLKIIAKILYADSGRIIRNGKIAALLELGSGFHPDLTGRENIFMNASILGFSKKDLRSRIYDILDFSGLHKFIDTKVKNYSSGMLMRLGFSVAIQLDPDILLFDEILAVGDENFQEKCMEKITEIKNKGKTIVFVSHDLNSVKKICDRAMLLHKGEQKILGEVDDILDTYHDILDDQKKKNLSGFEEDASGEGVQAPDPEGIKKRWGNREAEISKVLIKDSYGNISSKFNIGDKVTIEIYYKCRKRIELPTFGIAVHRDDGIHVCGPNSKYSNQHINYIENEGMVEFSIESLYLLSGIYHLSVAIYNKDIDVSFDHQNRMYEFQIVKGDNNEDKEQGIIYLPHRWKKII